MNGKQYALLLNNQGVILEGISFLIKIAGMEFDRGRCEEKFFALAEDLSQRAEDIYSVSEELLKDWQDIVDD